MDGITDWMDMNLSKFQEMVKDREDWHGAVHGVAKSWTRLSLRSLHYSKLEHKHTVLEGFKVVYFITCIEEQKVKAERTPLICFSELR